MERATGFALLLLLLACVTATQVQAQACRWDGTAPFCDGECGADESDTMRSAVGGPGIDRIESVNRFGNDCATGTKALCCKTPGRSCRWDGTAPFCDGGCRAGESPAEPPPDSSSGMACATGSKVYCCRVTSAPPIHQPFGTTPPPPPPLPPAPAAPTGCRVSPASTPRCGALSIECDRPLPVANQILIGSGAGTRVLRTVPELGLIQGEYINEGSAVLTVCAKNEGGMSCGERFAATLGPTLCVNPPVHPVCPSGSRPCPGKGCIPNNRRCDLIQ